MKEEAAPADRKRAYEMTARRAAVERTRERILETAYELFIALPYDEVTIDGIAEQAEVSRQTVHRQFGSKEDLVVAITDWRRPIEDDRSMQAEPGDIETAVRVQIDRYEAFGDAIVRFLELEGRIDAVDHFLEVGRDSHRAEIEHTFGPYLPSQECTERDHAVLALYAATDVMVWKLLRRDFGRSRAETETIIRSLVGGVLGTLGSRDEEGSS
jgi:AcrR family transcriptional regulator